MYSLASSAGNTRGLIEACFPSSFQNRSHAGLPRGIPAASLKQEDVLL